MPPEDFELGRIIGEMSERTIDTAKELKAFRSETNYTLKKLDGRVANLERQYVSWWFKMPLKDRRISLGLISSGTALVAMAIIDYCTHWISDWISGLFI